MTTEGVMGSGLDLWKVELYADGPVSTMRCACAALHNLL